jgi:pimeloyl-ACP methyl ester carboxylesterase
MFQMGETLMDDHRTIELHGHTVAFRTAGTGPALLLIHGIAGTNAVWDEVYGPLTADHTVIAPDLPGHGASGAPAGDYSLGAMAATVRDLLIALGHDRATVVGHSLGGGVAMQFSYLFPEYCERLVLISSGGLGRSVNPALRMAALPGAELVTAQLGRAVRLGARAAGALPSFGRTPGRVATELVRSVGGLADDDTRAAFHATLRAVVGPDGQRVFAGDRLYLAEEMPTLIIWGERDPIIPVGHGRRGHAAMPGSQFVVLEQAGHFPPLEDPRGVVDAIDEFIRNQPPAEPDPDRFRRLLRGERVPSTKSTKGTQ